MRIFLTSNRLILGVFANKANPGRKYAKDERLLYIVDIERITSKCNPFLISFYPFVSQRHSSWPPIHMTLQRKSMLVDRQSAAFCGEKSLFLRKNSIFLSKLLLVCILPAY